MPTQAGPSMGANDGDDCHLELVFSRRWKHVAVVRGFVQSYLAVHLPEDGPTNPERVAMAVSELMENAVKYSTGAGIKVAVSFSHTSMPLLRVVVENQAERESIRSVRELFDRVMAGEPLETYLTMMREAAAKGHGQSQLGLIRIRCESGCRLSLETPEDLVRFVLDL